MCRFFIVMAAGFLVSTSPAFAAGDESGVAPADTEVVAAASVSQCFDAMCVWSLAAPLEPPQRPHVLPAMYGMAAFLQAYDASSTLHALRGGLAEANPLMRPVTGSPLAFIALKASVTAASIVAAERLWKRDRRVAAVVMMVVSNGVLAIVATHNASVFRRAGL